MEWILKYNKIELFKTSTAGKNLPHPVSYVLYLHKKCLFWRVFLLLFVVGSADGNKEIGQRDDPHEFLLIIYYPQAMDMVVHALCDALIEGIGFLGDNRSGDKAMDGLQEFKNREAQLGNFLGVDTSQVTGRQIGSNLSILQRINEILVFNRTSSTIQTAAN
jgi:hypothetical protein